MYAIYNSTTSTSIPLNNLTQTNCAVTNASTMEVYGTTLRVTYAYTYDQPYTTQVVDNISYGGTSFFAQVPTFFVLLGVVVLILIIAIVIITVSKFGKPEETM